MYSKFLNQLQIFKLFFFSLFFKLGTFFFYKKIKEINKTQSLMSYSIHIIVIG